VTTDLQATLTAAERVEVAELVAGLHERGYRDIDRHDALHVGARIRHAGHRWPEAYERGTGVVLALTERSPSSWSQTYRMADVELIAVWDEDRLGGRVSSVAQYHVEAVGGGE
jgi:hypothetical protein